MQELQPMDDGSRGLRVPATPHLALAAMIDHTLLRPDATDADVVRLCDEALEHNFASVCVNGCYAALCAERLAASSVKPMTSGLR